MYGMLRQALLLLWDRKELMQIHYDLQIEAKEAARGVSTFSLTAKDEERSRA